MTTHRTRRYAFHKCPETATKNPEKMMGEDIAVLQKHKMQYADLSTQCSSPEECYQEREAWITVEQFILLLRERNAKPGAW
ncbi:hypothetical protein Q9966_010971 [Columba livia]|nr:hypothetical protein Q9966_010971 [Columba livia]